MKIEVKYKESETKTYIYDFEVGSDFKCKHVGTYISCRNDREDVWGHMWAEKYSKVFKAKREELLAANPDLDYCDIVDLEEYRRLKGKYNPVCHKTVNGDIYYSGCHFSDRGATEDKYKLKISKDKVRELILKQLNKKVRVI